MTTPQGLPEALPTVARTLRRFRPYLGRQRGLIAASLLALFAEMGLRLLEPWPLKVVVDAVTGRHGRVLPATDLLTGLPRLTFLTAVALALVVITGLRALAEYSSTVGFALIGNRVLSEIRAELYRHLQRLSLSFHAKARSGELVTRVINDIGLLRDVVVTAVLPLAANLLILAGMAGVMLWLNWRLTLLVAAMAPLFWLSAISLSHRIHEASRRQRQREGAVAAATAEAMAAINNVQALSLQDRFDQVFSTANRKSMSEEVKANRLGAALERRVDLLIAGATALVLWYGGRLVLEKALTAGDLIVFLTYLKNALRPVRDFAKYTGRLAKAAAAAERVVDLLERTPEVQDLPGAITAPRLLGPVVFDRVSFAYEPGRLVLQDVSFEASPGQRVAIVGPSGSGKTTLVSLLIRLYDPGQGIVRVGKHDIRRYTLDSFRSQVSVVLQDSLLFATSVRENIAYGAPDPTRAEIEAAARLANAREFIEALPEGYDTVLGERGITLSRGQRQRIAIARAAVRRAPILILDEPTTGLDEENLQAVIEALDRLAAGRTTFMITHDLDLARADLILVMDSGRLIEQGTHDGLMQLGGRYAALYRLQAGHARDRGKQVSHAGAP